VRVISTPRKEKQKKRKGSELALCDTQQRKKRKETKRAIVSLSHEKPFEMERNFVESHEGFMRREGVVGDPRDEGPGSRRRDYNPLGHPGGGPVHPSGFGHDSGGNGAWYE
jgi:hypothetical protein